MLPSSLLPSSAPPAGSVEDGSTSAAKSVTPDKTEKVPLWRSGVILAVAVLVGLAYWFNPPITVQPQAGVIMDLPVIVGDYYGNQGAISEAELTQLPKDTLFARRNYDDARGHQITCSIVLSGAEQRSIHRPEACMEGQGWTIIGEKTIPVPLDSHHPLTAEEITLERRVVLQNGDHITLRGFFDYWFVGQNVFTSSEMKRVLLSNWDRVVYNRAHRWAYVSLFSIVTDNLRPDGLNADQTRQLMCDFARQIVPTFQISERPPSNQN